MSDEPEIQPTEADLSFPVTPMPRHVQVNIDRQVDPAPRGQRQRDIANALTGDAAPGFIDTRFGSGSTSIGTAPALAAHADVVEPATEFNPADYHVDEVADYLAEHPEERDRVLEAERAGKARKTILGD